MNILNKVLGAASLIVLFGLSAIGTTMPAGFTETIVSNTLVAPTAMAIAPDGRIFVCLQNGELRVIKDGALLPTPFISLSVDSSGERGLLGVAFDPNFATNQFLYLYYTVPTNPEHNRVSRFIANGDVVAQGSETILLELNPLSSALNHNGGALHFGGDGMLYVSVGDNAHGANAQDLTVLLGKVLRINSDGTIPFDNPFVQSSTARQEIWAYGFRNPFTFAFNGNLLYINDVGQDTWEEIDLGQAGANYGWPTSEGPTTNPAFTPPIYYYGHNIGCAITGATFYSPAHPIFPSFYLNKYFFGDYCGGWIHVLDSSTGQASDFLTGASSIVDIHAGDDGNIYYLDRAKSSLLKISYSSNLLPVIETQPKSQLISTSYPVTFSVVATGPTPYSYQWQRNDVDISGATASSYKFTTQLTDNGAQFRVRVTNSYGSTSSDEATLSVTSNKPPTAQIITPVVGSTYYGGMVVNYSFAGTDKEDGTLPSSAFVWQVDFHHDNHFHPFIPSTTGNITGNFTIPTTGETSSNVYYFITLQITDSIGLSTTIVRNILPQKVKMTFATQPTGLKLSLDNTTPKVTPFSVTGVVGILRQLTATEPQNFDGNRYNFQSWTDNGARDHQISTPTTNTTYTASFSSPTPPASPANLVATAISSSQIKLGWTDNSNDETGFVIQRTTNPSGTWTAVTTTKANIITYTNGGLLASTTYYYRVRATNSNVGASSVWSNTATATTP